MLKLARRERRSRCAAIEPSRFKWVRWTALTLVLLLALGFALVAALINGYLPIQRENIWSIAVYEGESLDALRPSSSVRRPLLTAADVTDVDALFVADPCVVWDHGRGYMFFEVLNRDSGHGDIGLAVADDAQSKWTYHQIVLDEPFHVSFPQVYRDRGKFYMVPESEASGAVSLYEAIEFPTKWRKVGPLLTGTRLADPAIFTHNERWWMFTGRSGRHDQLRLFMADQLIGPWHEHPQSPIRACDNSNSRPAGRVISDGGQLFRLAQDCRGKYGRAVRAYRIMELTPEVFREQEAFVSPIVQAGAEPWNNAGMHHCDAHRMDRGWWVVTDGHTKRWIWD